MANWLTKAKVSSGESLAKSAWRVFKLDKELAFITLLQVALCLVVLGCVSILYVWLVASAQGVDIFNPPWTIDSKNFSWQLPIWQNLLFMFGLYITMTTVINFFDGAIIHGALERFRGGNPTIRSSLGAATRKIRPLLLFSLMMATVGLAMDILQERVPFFGKLLVFLANVGWRIANFFSVPAIMASDKDLHPFDATKESTKLIKKVWGEGVVANVSLGAAFLVVFMCILLAGFGVLLVTAVMDIYFGLSPLLLAPGGVLLVVALVLSVVVFMTLGPIVKAALYYYATTGKTPQYFNEQLLRSSITPRKARKIFG